MRLENISHKTHTTVSEKKQSFFIFLNISHMLRIWISTQGKVLPWITKWLQDAGYPFAKFPRSNRLILPEEGIEFIWIKWFDQIKYLFERGKIEACIIGSDIVWEIQPQLTRIRINSLLDFEMWKARLSWLVLPTSTARIEDILTKYPNLTASWLQSEEVVDFFRKIWVQIPDIIKVESQADTIIGLWEPDKMACDIVETGDTARSMGLLILDEEKDIKKLWTRFEPLPSIPCSVQLFWIESMNGELEKVLWEFALRLKMVINGRKYVAIKYNVQKSKLEQVLAITPENKSPTINETWSPDIVVVEILISKYKEAKIMFGLLQAGATDIFSYDPRLVI